MLLIIPFGHLGLKIYPKGLLMSIEKKKKGEIKKERKKEYDIRHAIKSCYSHEMQQNAHACKSNMIFIGRKKREINKKVVRVLLRYKAPSPFLSLVSHHQLQNYFYLPSDPSSCHQEKSRLSSSSFSLQDTKGKNGSFNPCPRVIDLSERSR